MRTLRKADIESMEKELTVMLNDEQFSVIGGIWLGCNITPSQGKDCVLQTVSYLSGVPYDVVENHFAVGLARETHPGETLTQAWIDEAKGNIPNQGVSAYGARALFDSLIGNSTMYNPDCQYDEGMEDVITGNQGPILATVDVNGSKHAVAVTGYDSGTFSYWDEQNGCSGTFDWEELEYFIVTGDISGNMGDSGNLF
jgi:hypothetical protein